MQRPISALLLLLLTLAGCGTAAPASTPAGAPVAAASVDAQATANAVAAANATVIAQSQPTSTPTPIPTPRPPTPTDVPRSLGLTPTPSQTATGLAGGAVIAEDENGWCQVTAPAGFTPVPGDPDAWTDQTARMIVNVTSTGKLDFATFIARPEWQWRPVNRSTDRYRSDSTDSSSSQSITSVVVLTPPDSRLPERIICFAALVYPQAQEPRYRAAAETMVASLRPVKR